VKSAALPSRGRHQSTSKECQKVLKKVETLPGVIGVIIGRSYGGKSLGKNSATGALKIQRREPGGLKAVTQTAKGLQEIFIRVEAGQEAAVEEAVREVGLS
jgi:hypothetical protein